MRENKHKKIKIKRFLFNITRITELRIPFKPYLETQQNGHKISS